MTHFLNKHPLISHTVSPLEINQIIQEKTEQIMQEGDKPYVTAQRKIEILNQLGEFDFGRFLLQNKGMNRILA